MSASLSQLATCVTITDHPTSEASVSRIISASGFGNTRVAELARACFTASYAAHSCTFVKHRNCCNSPALVGYGIFRRASTRSESCVTPSPLITLPHHFTSCLYTHDFTTLNLKPNFAVSSSSSCSLSRYVSMSAAYSNKSSIHTNKCVYSNA
ncbi:Hypothetical protein PHPALM_20581 [Phytophthora palmivora]|uniref:Uncharacterized protein n=1 Tax=Phytophthora palmivora TaxID=4796 RepID=A0A2P4XEI5_9STRA|nr:Hypothetical protein PHPALM_20581 [Phytophthora palmivora]